MLQTLAVHLSVKKKSKQKNNIGKNGIITALSFPIYINKSFLLSGGINYFNTFKTLLDVQVELSCSVLLLFVNIITKIYR